MSNQRSPESVPSMSSLSNRTSSAYLLVVHGSRDPRPQQAIENLVQQLTAQLQGKTTRQYMIGWAALELQPQPLHQQICQFAADAIVHKIDRLEVIPLFLLPGVHVKEDIPAEVELARQKIGTHVKISIRPHLGSYPSRVQGLIELLKSQSEIEAWVILSHGTRHPDGNQPIADMTVQLHQQFHKPVLAAYWSVPPNLETQIQALINSGYDRIGILPYFLFAGGITDAIAQSVERLSDQFPRTQFELAHPVGVSADLIEQILLQG